jgi:hypothetical protein
MCDDLKLLFSCSITNVYSVIQFSVAAMGTLYLFSLDVIT